MDTRPEITVSVEVLISPVNSKHLKDIKLKLKILQKKNEHTIEKNFHQFNGLISQLSKKFYFSDEIIPKPKKLENSGEKNSQLKIEIEKFLEFICGQHEITQNFDFVNFFENGDGNFSETTPISSLTSEDGFLLSESVVTAVTAKRLEVDGILSRSYNDDEESKTGSPFQFGRRKSLPLLEIEQNQLM
jgi:hypothetical protein